MAKLFFEDRFLFARPNEITVSEFTAWRRTGHGKRKFIPFCIINVHGLDLIIEGYDAMWQFLDCLHPKLPRNGVNASMKGDMLYEHGIVFQTELQELINESDNPYLRFDISVIGRFRFPNSNDVAYDALKVDSVSDASVKEQIDLSLSELQGFIGWFNYPTKTEHFRTAIYNVSAKNRFILIHTTSDGFLISTTISRGKKGNIRPTRTKRVMSLDSLTDLFSVVAKQVENYEYNEVDFGLLAGDMFFKERDSIEYNRSSILSATPP